MGCIQKFICLCMCCLVTLKPQFSCLPITFSTVGFQVLVGCMDDPDFSESTLSLLFGGKHKHKNSLQLQSLFVHGNLSKGMGIISDRAHIFITKLCSISFGIRPGIFFIHFFQGRLRKLNLNGSLDFLADSRSFSSILIRFVKTHSTSSVNVYQYSHSWEIFRVLVDFNCKLLNCQLTGL